jgi:hypothetical protein
VIGPTLSALALVLFAPTTRSRATLPAAGRYMKQRASWVSLATPVPERVIVGADSASDSATLYQTPCELVPFCQV